MNIIYLQAIIIKIMKFFEFHERNQNIMKIKKNRAQIKNFENHKIPNEKHQQIMKII